MSEETQNSAESFMSLMDLTTMDTTEIKAVRGRLQQAGIYVVNFTNVTVNMKVDEVDPDKSRANVRWEGVIESFQPLEDAEEEGVDPEAMIGRAFNQFRSIPLRPADEMRRAIGQIKGEMYHLARFPTVGPLGGDPDGEPGWLENVVGQRVAIRVRHATNKDGDTRAYIDWLSPALLNQIDGIDWEDMQRPALNPDGTEQDEKQMAS